MATETDVVTVERFIPAPAEAIFELISDPQRHAEMDGGGSIVQARGRAGRRLKLGDSFGMDMKIGLSYSTRNVVIAYEPNRVLAWQTLAPAPLDKLITGRIWRYELEPAEGGTLVRETWDIRQERVLSKMGVRRMGPMTRRNMLATLARIEEIVTAPAS